MVLKQAAYLLVLSVVFGLGVNLVSPNNIDYIGSYRTLHRGSGPILPPDPAPGDPPYIGVDVAELEFSMGKALFVDAREPEEFECGTIQGAINIPFDHLPDENLESYLDSALAEASGSHTIITFCSGEECDASLHLARNLQAFGYPNVSIFFGGSREWERFGLPIQRRRQCDD